MEKETDASMAPFAVPAVPDDKPMFTQKQVDAIVTFALAKATGLLNGIPHHLHKCPDGHEWLCSSPYCEDVNAVPRQCVEHGGAPPIVKGQEPWRGQRA